MVSVRTVLVSLGIAFTAYLTARGLAWTEHVAYPIVVLGSVALYLLTTLLCLLYDRGPDTVRTDDMPLTAGIHGPASLPGWLWGLALATALIVPNAVTLGVGPEYRAEPFATWYIGGIGALMTIVMVRRRTWAAWIGIGILTAVSMTWLGPGQALALGLVGSIVWVLAAQLLLRSMDRAARDTARLAELQRAASAWRAAQDGRQRERRIQVQRALAVAGPVLSRTIASGGALSPDERDEARLAEGRLRDELRAPRLLDEAVREALDAARSRGATVTVLDEGGLLGVSEEDLTTIRQELAETVAASVSERIYIRTSPDDRVAVTVVGRSGVEGLMSDEDSVDLWREIRHPGAEKAASGA